MNDLLLRIRPSAYK